MRTPFIITILGLPALVAGLAMNTAVEHLRDRNSPWLAGSIIIVLLAVDTFLLIFTHLLRKSATPAPAPVSPAPAGANPDTRPVEDPQEIAA